MATLDLRRNKMALDNLDHEALTEIAQFVYDTLDWRLIEQDVALRLMEVRKESKARVQARKKKADKITASNKAKAGVSNSGEAVNCPACDHPLRLSYPRGVLSDSLRVSLGESMSITGYCAKCEELVRATCTVKEVELA